MAKKRKSKRRDNIQIYNMKKKLKEDFAKTTRQKLLDDLIEDISLETLKETLKEKTVDFIPKNPNENIFSSVLALQKSLIFFLHILIYQNDLNP